MRIAVDDVSAAFGDIVALDRFTCQIPSNSIVAIAGPSGSGKTTLLAMLAGALRPTSGEIRFENEFGDEVERPSTSWVSQSSNTLPDRTATENVEIAGLARGLSLDESRRQAHRCLGALGLDHRAGSPARLLSGGEQQRLAFARALAAEARLVLADEPTANLDESNTDRLIMQLRHLARDRTIVVATHDPRVMAACDEVIAMRNDAVRPISR